MKKFALFGLISLSVIVVACSSGEDTAGQVIKSASAGNNLNVSLSSADGVLRQGRTEFTLSFTDASGNPVDVGAVALNFHMPQMGTMPAMNNVATFTTTETPGIYRGRANIEMAGEWQAQITYEGPAGKGQASFQVITQK
jgi:hypothetical protein